METTFSKERVSDFAQIVDKMRMMSEEEIKLLYIQIFKDEIAKDMKNLLEGTKLMEVSDEEIDNAFTEIRYGTNNK